jgi:hypothetical protein
MYVFTIYEDLRSEVFRLLTGNDKQGNRECTSIGIIKDLSYLSERYVKVGISKRIKDLYNS